MIIVGVAIGWTIFFIVFVYLLNELLIAERITGQWFKEAAGSSSSEINQSIIDDCASIIFDEHSVGYNTEYFRKYCLKIQWGNESETEK